MDFAPIGVLRSHHASAKGTPVQPCFAAGCPGWINLFPGLVDGLMDLEGFERIWVIFAFDRTEFQALKVLPYRDTAPHGIFATRAPARPNPIGMSCVRLKGIRGHVLDIEDVDILDGTPVLDIKPYIPEYDAYPGVAAGWVDASAVRQGPRVADERFEARRMSG
jgi:tRNA-Thr(GGU) m(6)t(6)A37 methyltransferase TsaA